MYQLVDHVKKAGFSGFRTISTLWLDPSPIPKERGIYMIVDPNADIPRFLSKGVGGFHKQRDPNIPVSELAGRWVKDCRVVYIGKAGGIGRSATLYSRLKQYLDFGKGKPAGHYGGRLIWQLEHHPELLIAWKATPEGEPRDLEGKLIAEFEAFYGKLPFANLQR